MCHFELRRFLHKFQLIWNDRTQVMEILVKLVRFGDTVLYGLFRLVNELIWESDSYENCSGLPKLSNDIKIMNFGAILSEL